MVYGFPEREIIGCPFCGNEISVLYFPETKRPRKASWGGQAANIKTRSEQYIVQENCLHCKKSKEEIQKALDEKTREESKKYGKAFEKFSFSKKTS